MVRQLSTVDECNTVIKDAGNKLVVIDFFATWCGPCRYIAPELETMEKEMVNSVIFVKVDVDTAEDLAAKYSISLMPTFVLIKNGLEVEKVTGANSENLRTAITKHM